MANALLKDDGALVCFTHTYKSFQTYCSTQEGMEEFGVFSLMENCFMVDSSAFSFPEKYAAMAL